MLRTEIAECSFTAKYDEFDQYKMKARFIYKIKTRVTDKGKVSD